MDQPAFAENADLNAGSGLDATVMTSRAHPLVTFQAIAASAALCSMPLGRFRWIPSRPLSGRTREAVTTGIRPDPARPPVIFLVPEQF